ncbi:MAG: hypothetical protein ACOX3T_06220 [Bdellovibrionota bacterium]
MKINPNDIAIRQELLSKILNKDKSEESSAVQYKESDASKVYANDEKRVLADKVNISLAQYISDNISKEAILSEREAKVAKLKELYNKGEYRSVETRELAQSFVDGIEEEISIARNTIFFDEDE